MTQALRALRSARALAVFSLASVVANVVIVVTGGAVRLTASGLGCPTWPRCTAGSLVRTRATGTHGIIEFTNRTLTVVLLLVAVATLVAAIGQRRQIRLAALALAGIPAQAVLGGISVLTHLNPWVVSGHLLLSMAIIAVTINLWWRVTSEGHEADGRSSGGSRPAVLLATLVVAVTAAVLVLGTVVTGSGPHAGAQDVDGTVHRNGLDPAAMSQLHADAVMVLIGLSVGLFLLLRAVGAAGRTRRSAAVLVAVELAQGLIGFVQYFTDVPAVLVGIHMFGACAVWVTAVLTLLRVRAGARLEQLGHGVDDQPDQTADQGPVDPDELKVAPDLELQPPARLGRVPARDRA